MGVSEWVGGSGWVCGWSGVSEWVGVSGWMGGNE